MMKQRQRQKAVTSSIGLQQLQRQFLLIRPAYQYLWNRSDGLNVLHPPDRHLSFRSKRAAEL